MTRRSLLQAGASALAAQAASAQTKVSPNDKIRIATIGHGGMGQGDTGYARSIPGVELVAVCDLYDGRLEHAKELYGNQIFTTRDYREILTRIFEHFQCGLLALNPRRQAGYRRIRDRSRNAGLS